MSRTGSIALVGLIISFAFIRHVSAGCVASSSQCSHDGSSGYVDLSGITYSSSTGKFSGSIVTNQCPNYVYSNYSYSGATYTSQGGAMPTCTTVNIQQYTGPIAAPLRQSVGYTIAGQNIFGPMDNGFTTGSACSTSQGSCDAGTDVYVCMTQLAQQCGSSFEPWMGLDVCGGHASPYHNHQDPLCLYDHAASGHSPLVGFALDGYGIYGVKESTYSFPTDLDWCGGHTGVVPAFTLNGVTYPSTSVYHYHIQTNAPFTLGCYGPASSYAVCAAMYSTCGTGYSTLTGTGGCSYSYDTDCPCFGSALTYTKNQMCGVSTTVPAAITYTPWGSSSGGLSGGAIAGIVIGSIIGFVALIGVGLFIRNRMGKTRTVPLKSEGEGK